MSLWKKLIFWHQNNKPNFVIKYACSKIIIILSKTIQFLYTDTNVYLVVMLQNPGYIYQELLELTDPMPVTFTLGQPNDKRIEILKYGKEFLDMLALWQVQFK